MKAVLSSFTNKYFSKWSCKETQLQGSIATKNGVSKKINCKEDLLQNKISEGLLDKPIRYPFVNLMHTTSSNQEIHNTVMGIL
jgi:hypothetical protein